MRDAEAHTPDPHGARRVVDPPGVMPHHAWRLDASPITDADEMLCAVEWLKIDAASFEQIVESTDGTPEGVARHIHATIAERGKQHDAITDGGGMFIGRVAEIGAALRSRIDLREGDAIAALASLTVTPLHVDDILDVDMARGRLRVRGHAILFSGGSWTRLPEHLPAPAALPLFHIAGVPAQVSRRAREGARVLIVGADGTSGMLACAAATLAVGYTGRVIGVVPDAKSPGSRILMETNLAEIVQADARDARAMHAVIAARTRELPELVVNCMNVGGTELGSILCTRERGTLCFFSEATSFHAAALGAESLGRDIDMLIGNGYVDGHAIHAMRTLAAYPELERYFVAVYGRA